MVPQLLMLAGSGENVTILDLIMTPRDKGAAFTAYALYQNTDYGKTID
jgi:hypothetical protein